MTRSSRCRTSTGSCIILTTRAWSCTDSTSPRRRPDRTPRPADSLGYTYGSSALRAVDPQVERNSGLVAHRPRQHLHRVRAVLGEDLPRLHGALQRRAGPPAAVGVLRGAGEGSALSSSRERPASRRISLTRLIEMPCFFARTCVLSLDSATACRSSGLRLHETALARPHHSIQAENCAVAPTARPRSLIRR